MAGKYKPWLPPANRLLLSILRLGKKKKTKPKRGFTTKRTAAISERLKEAGIDQATIDRLRGRKKTK